MTPGQALEPLIPPRSDHLVIYPPAMTGETLEEQIQQLRSDLAALEARVKKIEGERNDEKRKQTMDDLQFRSYGG